MIGDSELNCLKCGGAGWVWWFELNEYHGPASDSSDCYSDDTRYPCDRCEGDKNLQGEVVVKSKWNVGHPPKNGYYFAEIESESYREPWKTIIYYEDTVKFGHFYRTCFGNDFRDFKIIRYYEDEIVIP